MAAVLTVLRGVACAAPPPRLSPPEPPEAGEEELLSLADWRQLDETVDRGLEFLSRHQLADGSFKAPDLGQPGITSLCVLAFLSRGHVPEYGPYGKQLTRAIEFVLDSQQDNGMLFDMPIGPVWQNGTPTHTAMYNHAIAGLMLGEVYGMTAEGLQARIAAAIPNAIAFTRERQLQPKRNPVDLGGWRYLGSLSGVRSDVDLSVTSWQLVFLRSARNAEFDVPREYIDEAMAYVRRAFEPGERAFTYCRVPPGDRTNRAMVGSGILSLSLGGEHQSEMARQGGDWILEHPFERYNHAGYSQERFHYSAYYCSQAMFQLGGDYWRTFFPPLMQMLIENQQADGSWPREQPQDGNFGNNYTTALVILTLTPPYQLLPIYQR